MIVVRRVYFCPHCQAKQWFFSLLPVWTRLWKCPRCGQKFVIDPACLGSNWGVSLALWSLPLVFFLSEPLILVAAILDRSRSRGPFPPIPIPQMLVMVVVGGGACALGAAFFMMFVGYFAGLIYGAAVGPPRTAEPPRPRRRR